MIKGEGLPIRGKGKRGDMYVRFDVEFPTTDWAKGVEVDGGESTKVELPGRKPDLGLSPEQIVVRELSDKPVN